MELSKINGIHVNDTRPFFYNNQKKETDYQIHDFDLLFSILSAITWKKNNGKIKMYTDLIGYNYYKKHNLLDVWDEFDIETLPNFKQNINYKEYWAAGKIIALANETNPVCVMDTDFMCKVDISKKIEDFDTIVGIHPENMLEWVYPPKEELYTPPDYSFNKAFDWDVLATNGAFVYFGDVKLKDFYCGEALRFMINNYKETERRVSQMCFAEQRLLSMVGTLYEKDIKYFKESVWDLYEDGQEEFTHIWGTKEEIKSSFENTKEWCLKVINRILSDFPEYSYVIYENERFSRYLD